MLKKPLIVIPVKGFDEAKSRLGGIFLPHRRATLARRLCERTLRFFDRRLPEYDLLVVTSSSFIAELAHRHGAQVLKEPVAEGLSRAAERAAAWSHSHGYSAQLLIPTDIAHLDEAEIRTLLATYNGSPGVALCPANDAGTNALLTSPPDAIPFRFGERSSVAHKEAAARLGLPCQIIELTHLRFDLDTPEDLNTLDSIVQQQGSNTPQELKRLWKLCSTLHATKARSTWMATQ
ncbi:MAG: 2-phospho-L-lactate guanylyltransferase [Marinobacter sp.]|uniref:2-phospho-L-lactate guanylyltransferase n=1 Tax=Marinobacter sp. AC-23 TaxID=1879031 RepID=UPI0008DD92AC|nr:2-phospho-L-lactate guanylyltransferase [Marinobacter sp. AC-23]OHY81715.1 2-phospho-L-lactate guanylyltransferase [Marinobacter sp. AC-23]